MGDDDVDCWVALAEAGGELLGAVDGAVLSAGAAKGYTQVREVTLKVFVDALRYDGFGVNSITGRSLPV